jgi:hypothetical protein
VPISPQRFGQLLSSAGYESVGRVFFGGKQQRCYLGLALLSEQSGGDPPDDEPPAKYVYKDLPDADAENGKEVDILDREIGLNSDLKKSHMANPKSMSSMSSMSSNTDVLDKPAEEQPHVTDDLFGVGGAGGVGFDPEDTSRARTRSALRGENLPRPTPTYTTNDVQPDKPAEEQPHISDDTPPPDTVRQLRLQVVGAIKCGDDDSLARLLPRLRQVSEKDYREVCAKYRLTPLNQEQPE